MNLNNSSNNLYEAVYTTFVLGTPNECLFIKHFVMLLYCDKN